MDVSQNTPQHNGGLQEAKADVSQDARALRCAGSVSKMLTLSVCDFPAEKTPLQTESVRTLETSDVPKPSFA